MITRHQRPRQKITVLSQGCPSRLYGIESKKRLKMLASLQELKPSSPPAPVPKTAGSLTWALGDPRIHITWFPTLPDSLGPATLASLLFWVSEDFVSSALATGTPHT